MKWKDLSLKERKQIIEWAVPLGLPMFFGEEQENK